MDAHNQEIKKDAGKIRLDLIPVECIEALGKVLTMGAEKYHDNSWREGMNYSRVYAATQRHLQAFWGESQDTDAESKLPHLFHALCNISFLITYEENKERYRTFDDRAGSNNEFYRQREELVSSITKLVQDNPSFFECRVGDDTLQKVYDTLDYAIHSPYTTVKEKQNFPDLTKMTYLEAYKHLEVGMRVKVLRKANYEERGWPVGWPDPMDKYVGGEFLIEKMRKHVGVVLRYEKGGCTWNFPPFVLEIISNPEPEEEPAFPDLTKMTHPEACEHLEVGMKVKLLCQAEDHEKFWSNAWVDGMDDRIGKAYTVRYIDLSTGVSFTEVDYKYPAFVLEIVSGPKGKV